MHAESFRASGGGPPIHDGPSSYNRQETREVGSPHDQGDILSAGSRQRHVRDGSGATGAASSGEYNDSQHLRHHDYDVQAMESDLSIRPGSMFRNAIPAPTVTIRSEFPTLNRSRQQQPLTCLITVEVPEGSWQPGMDEIPPMPPPRSSRLPNPQSDFYAPKRSISTRESRPVQYEPQERLDEVAEDLRMRVDNWHGLDFRRYAKYIYANYYIRTIYVLVWHLLHLLHLLHDNF